MSEQPRDARLEQDEFYLYSWATGGDGGRIGRRYSDRAKERTTTRDGSTEASLNRFTEGEEVRTDD